MERPLLTDQEVQPTKEVLKNALGESYVAFDELLEIITNSEVGLAAEWRYYKDGKSWLCKVTFKKKTIFWLSVWDQYFKVGFYFMERNRLDIENLDIQNSIKDDFKSSKNIGKLLPLVVNMRKKEQIPDVLKIVEYKKSLK